MAAGGGSGQHETPAEGPSGARLTVREGSDHVARLRSPSIGPGPTRPRVFALARARPRRGRARGWRRVLLAPYEEGRGRTAFPRTRLPQRRGRARGAAGPDGLAPALEVRRIGWWADGAKARSRPSEPSVRRYSISAEMWSSLASHKRRPRSPAAHAASVSCRQAILAASQGLVGFAAGPYARCVRYLHAAFLFAFAVVAGLAAIGALWNLWADYQDSPTSTYLLIGLPSLALSVAAVAAGVLVLRRR
jgi:hypothetical protein